MADLRTSFVTLEDASTQAGLPIHKALEGDAILNKNAHGALVAKDNSDNFKYLEVDPAGALKVSMGADYACLSDDGEDAAGSATYVTIASITLTVDKVYKDLEALVSSFRDSVFQVLWIDNEGDPGEVSTTLVSGVRVGAGDYNEMVHFACMEFTAGSTGTQKLLIQGKNLNALSAMSATLSIKEMAY